MTLTRRHLLRGMGALLAAPAIVRAASLMPVRSLACDFTTDAMTVVATERFITDWRHAAIGLGYAIMQNGSKADATIPSAIAAAVRAEERRRAEMLSLPRPIFA